MVSSLLVPMAISTTLFVMVFNPRLQEACGLRESIGYTIIFAVMILISLLIVVMGTVLCHRTCRRRSLVLSEYDKQHKKALYEMLPLLMYPILFLLISTPIFVVTLTYVHNNSLPITTIFSMFAMYAPLWSFTASLFFIFHLCVVRHVTKHKLQRIKNALHKVRLHREAEEESVAQDETTKLHACLPARYCSIPKK